MKAKVAAKAKPSEQPDLFGGAVSKPKASAGPAPAPAPTPAATNPTAQRAAPPPAAIPSMSSSMSGGSEVYRIEADGYTRKLWSHASDFVYAITFDDQGRAILVARMDDQHLRLLQVIENEFQRRHGRAQFCSHGSSSRIEAR